MSGMEPIKLFETYGLAGLVIGVLFFIILRMLIWVMAFIKDIMKQHSEERSAWLVRLEKLGDNTEKISQSIDEHDRRADERGKYVRFEHEKMITNLEEQGKVLARINGYKA